MLTTIQTCKGSSKVVTFAMLFLDFSEGPRACVTAGFLKPRVTAAILGARKGLASAVLLLNDRALLIGVCIAKAIVLIDVWGLRPDVGNAQDWGRYFSMLCVRSVSCRYMLRKVHRKWQGQFCIPGMSQYACCSSTRPRLMSNLKSACELRCQAGDRITGHPAERGRIFRASDVTALRGILPFFPRVLHHLLSAPSLTNLTIMLGNALEYCYA